MAHTLRSKGLHDLEVLSRVQDGKSSMNHWGQVEIEIGIAFYRSQRGTSDPCP